MQGFRCIGASSCSFHTSSAPLCLWHADRTVVLTGIMEFSEERQVKGGARIIPFEEAFDRSGLEALQPVTYLSEMRENGWDGKVDHVAIFPSKVRDQDASDL